MPLFPVPGSEVFATRITDRDQLRRALPDSLRLHEVDDAQKDQLDALTYEVIRHRLWATTERMGQGLARMSGSMVVTDCNDIGVVITDEFGDIVQIGPYVISLAAVADMAIKWILEHRGNDTGIREGDMYLCNDPWVGGALHQNDVAIIAPMFHDGKLFAWTATMAHQVDLGGVAPGSWTPRAQDVFWESLPTPPVRVVRNHEIQADVVDVYLRRSRVPKIVGLDLRAKIGSNRVGHERLAEIIEKYGADAVKSAMYRQMDDAELRLRSKLAKIADGTWTGTSYQEQSHTGDRGAHKIHCTLTKTGEELVFDFTGTTEQSGMINCPYSGLHGGLMAGLILSLCADIPWATGGLWRVVKVISEPGTLNNAEFPAGVGKASVASGYSTLNVVEECLAKMTDSSDELHGDASAKSCGAWDLCVLAGLDQYGNPFATMLTDSMGAGYGARTVGDGVDTGGILQVPMGRMPDVEMMEFMSPILYLWRREETDSGGPGTFRGGLAASLAIVPHDTAMPMAQVVSGSGKTIPQNVGLAGGYPGNNQVDIAVRGADVAELFRSGRIPDDLQQITGEVEVLSCEEEPVLSPGDVHYMCWQAGGGYGDPLLRAPERVLADVVELRVSAPAARDLYGVVVTDDLRLDAAATTGQRQQLRDQRRSRAREGQQA